MNNNLSKSSDTNRTMFQSKIAREGRDISQVVPTLVQGLSRLPTNCSTHIKNFLHEYLGTPCQLVPFGGRQAELHALDAWLDDPTAPPYALLAAEAGRGKSALLVRWAQSLVARDAAHVVFVPISIRFNTALESVTFTTLAARLGEVHGEPVKWANLSAREWRGVCQRYLSRTLPDDKPLVVIIDGLDEAADWQVDEEFFPQQPPSGVHVVVSARYLAGEMDESGWRRRLGFQSDKLAVSLPIPPLTAAGVSDVLRQMGNPLDKLATKVDVVGELFRLSEGDPLLVRLYVDALLPAAQRVVMMKPEALRELKPGLEGYFERWWDEQQQLWGQPYDEGRVQVVLNLLACAMGPLTEESVLALAPSEANFDSRTLSEAIASLARFIVGDGKKQGYTFSHPRLGYYFWERLNSDEQRASETRFLDFGYQTRIKLSDGSLDYHDASPYAIQYYGAHLERADAPSAAVSSAAFFGLVSEGWLRAWEALEGTYAGFLSDVERAWRRAKDERNIAMQVKCALCRASVIALSSNMPPQLLALAVQHSLLTSMQALVILQQTPDEEQRADALSELLPYLSETTVEIAMSIALEIKDSRKVGEAVSRLAARSSPELLTDVFSLVQKNECEFYKAKTISKLAAHLPAKLLAKALIMARDIKHEREQPDLWRKLVYELWKEVVAHLPPHLLRDALTITGQIADERWRGQALSMLAKYLTPDLLPEAMTVVRTIKAEWYLANTLIGLAEYLPQDLLHEALALARKIREQKAQADVLRELARHLPSPEKQLVIGEMAKCIEIYAWGQVGELRRTGRVGCYDLEELSKLTAGFTEAAKRRVADKLLPSARKISDGWERAQVLSELAVYLPEDEKLKVLREAMAVAKDLKEPYRQIATLVRIAEHLPPLLLTEVLAEVKGIEDQFQRSRLLNELVPHLPPELTFEAVETLKAIEDSSLRLKSLSQLAQHSPPQFLADILAMVQAASEGWKVGGLRDLAPHLPPGLLREALAMARNIRNDGLRAQALSCLVGYLPEPEKEQAIDEALTAARTIGQDLGSAKQFIYELKGHVPPQLLDDMLATTKLLLHEREQIKILSQIASCFAGPERERVIAESLTLVRKLEDIQSRASALTVLAGLRAKAKQKPLVREALAAARFIRDTEQQVRSLSHLLAYFPKAAQKEASHDLFAIVQVSDHEYEWTQAKILSQIAADLPPQLRGQVLVATYTAQDPGAQCKALSQLVTLLPPEQLAQVLTFTQNLKNERDRLDALIQIAAYSRRHACVSPSRLKPALNMAQTIRRESYRAEALSQLAPHLPNELLSQALISARHIRHDRSRAKALSGLLPHLAKPEQAACEELAAMQESQSERKMWSDLLPWSVLLQYLPEPEKGQTIVELRKAVREMPTKDGATNQEQARVQVLSQLSAYLPLSEKKQILRQALKDSQIDAAMLNQLMPVLPPELNGEALAAARAVRGDYKERVEALFNIVPYLPEPEKANILQEILSMPSGRRRCSLSSRLDQERAKVMCRVATLLPEPEKQKVLDKVLAMARLRPNKSNHWAFRDKKRAWVLCQVATLLPEPEKQQVLYEALAVTIRNEPNLAHLPMPKKQEMLYEALDTMSDYHDVELISQVLPHLPKPQRWEILSRTLPKTPRQIPQEWQADLLTWAHTQPVKAHTVWAKKLAKISSEPRPTFQKNLNTLIPFALALSEDTETTAMGIFRAIQEVCEWWP